MSTLELENIKHPYNSGNNIELAADGSINVKAPNNQGIKITPTGASSTNYLDFYDTGGGPYGRLGYDHNASAMTFRTYTSEKMRLTYEGNLGLGTTTPLRKLHVASAGDTHIILQSTNAADNSEIFEIGAGANSASKVDLTFRTRLNSGSGGTEHMRITNDGYVTTPNQVSFYARVSGAWSSAGNAAEIVPSAAFNTTPLWNNGNGFSGNRFTAPIAGKYMFIFSAEKANNAADATHISIHKNGSEIDNARIYHASQDHRKTLQYTMIMDLAVNDYAEPYTNSYRSGVAWDNRGQFAGYLIG